ncbi:5'-nucleotidase C-terminal domain-containing protein [Microbacterium sp. SS28]|uniref:5'-nucleotidase C-terminal domain-containing protein n=1 Tax=Microbacterium sp. SS28 TaxID=2919948 RepID=UPI001FA9CF61|nr:5'-nucleotidase C-terminal domain-containing protein [Microbacterium sp. SS28]
MPAHAADDVTLNILTVNDFHGRIDNNTVKFAGTIEGLRAADGANGDNSLLIGAGDFIGASLFASSILDDQPTIDVFNDLGMVASAVGNHEFDKGWDDLSGRVIDGGANATWDYLGANVYLAGTTTPALPEYGIYEAGGVSVGVIGAVTEETPQLVSPGGVSDLSFGDPVAAINRVADQLTDDDEANGEADVVIAVLHEGAPDGTQSLDNALAQSPVFAKIVNQTSAKVAAIVNGHTHQAYAYNAPVPGAPGTTRPVLQTGNYAANVGQIKLTVDRDTMTVTSSTVGNVPRVATDNALLISQYPGVLGPINTTVQAALAEAAIIGNQPIGTQTADITTALPNPALPPVNTGTGNRDDRAKESTLGTLVADAVLSALAPPDRGGAQFTVVNPGGLRAELLYAANPANSADAAGRILYSEANEVLPFVNNLATVDMTGAQVKKLLEQQWQRTLAGTVPSRPYLALSTSTGFSYTFDAALPEGSRITSIFFDGSPLDPAATYRVGTFTFLTGTGTPSSAGGDNFHVFREATNFKDSGLVDRDAWIAYLQANPGVSPDFRKHSLSVTGLNTAPAGADVDSITVGSLDLTSAGSPANTQVAASFGPTADGVGAVPIGTGAVTAGGSTFDLTWPVQAATAGYLILTAQPTGTQAVIPVTLAPPTASVVATAAAVKYGSAPKVGVTVTAPGQTVTGDVSVQDAGGTVLGTATLKNGAATVTLGRTALQPGSHTLTVVYGGSSTAAGSSTTVELVVNKASSTTFGLSTSLIVGKNKASKVLVVVAANGGVPVAGPVTISYQGQTIGTGTVANGTATVSITGFPTRGVKTLSISYGGSETVAPSTGSATLLVF